MVKKQISVLNEIFIDGDNEDVMALVNRVSWIEFQDNVKSDKFTKIR